MGFFLPGLLWRGKPGDKWTDGEREGVGSEILKFTLCIKNPPFRNQLRILANLYKLGL